MWAPVSPLLSFPCAMLGTVVTVLLIPAACRAVLGQNSSIDCSNLSSCDKCVAYINCYWCQDSSKCYDYKFQHISTYFEHCSWSEARWKFCWLNVMALVVSLSVISGICIIILLVCCCCCCRKYRNYRQRRIERDEAAMQRQEEERKIQREEKKAEHQARTNVIRTKYGLLKEDDRE